MVFDELDLITCTINICRYTCPNSFVILMLCALSIRSKQGRTVTCLWVTMGKCYLQGAARKSFTTKSEQKKAELKNVMRMNQLE